MKPTSIPASPLTYSVNLWGSNPEEDNDDLWTGADYATLAEAQAVVADFKAVFPHSADHTLFIEIDGPDHYSLTKNPRFDFKRHERERAREDREWKREAAMQAGMAFGVDGYNDEMGF